nr:hypothetical protein CFP56_01027 [Quercus suber]
MSLLRTSRLISSSRARLQLVPNITARAAQRHFSSTAVRSAGDSHAHEDHYDPPGGWLWGVKPGEKPESEAGLAARIDGHIFSGPANHEFQDLHSDAVALQKKRSHSVDKHLLRRREVMYKRRTIIVLNPVRQRAVASDAAVEADDSYKLQQHRDSSRVSAEWKVFTKVDMEARSHDDTWMHILTSKPRNTQHKPRRGQPKAVPANPLGCCNSSNGAKKKSVMIQNLSVLDIVLGGHCIGSTYSRSSFIFIFVGDSSMQISEKTRSFARFISTLRETHSRSSVVDSSRDNLHPESNAQGQQLDLKHNPTLGHRRNTNRIRVALAHCSSTDSDAFYSSRLLIEAIYVSTAHFQSQQLRPIQLGMVSRSFPGYPSFAHGLRLATPADLSRLAELSVLGFKDSEIFRYERPEYNKFPFDAVTSFYNIYRAQLVNPRAVVIVAEDNQRSDEAIHLSSQSKDRLDDSNAHSERVVVGVGIWILPSGSIREGQFVPPCVGDPLPAPNRDLCLRRLERFVHIAETTEEK